MRIIVALVMIATAFGFAAPGFAQSPDTTRCQGLAGDYSGIEDAPTQVVAARLIAEANGIPAHCELTGYITPNVGFLLALPVANWTGRFLENGCGGFCGALQPASCEVPLQGGFACIVSDLGHRSTSSDAKWAYNDLQAKIDFGYRATHVVLLAGRAIAEKYYGKAAHHSYFVGCSTGGRQAFNEVERFPWDFDGIVGGAPSINLSGAVISLAWSAIVTLGPDGRSLVSPDDLKNIHAAALAMCDADDGLKDGIIGDPRSCKFDPARVPGLSAAQLSALRKIYSGPVNGKGEALSSGGPLPGSELNWIGSYLATDGGPGPNTELAQEMFRYLGFLPDLGPSYDFTKFNWDRDYKRFGMTEGLYGAANPDLRKFKASGGKLLTYQGWDDPLVLPVNIVEFYEDVERLMGGRAKTQDFFRLFMMPGMGHCRGGEGADTVDYLAAIVDWVEHGRAPDMLTAYRLKTAGGTSTSFPVDEANIAFARPVYPYPVRTRYKGGDANAASSFGPTAK